MSYYAATCELVTETVQRDELGVPRETAQPREVFCNVFRMADASFYAAAQQGYHPEAQLQIRKAEYAGERLVLFGGKPLRVIRADTSSPDYVVLTLEEEVGTRGK